MSPRLRLAAVLTAASAVLAMLVPQTAQAAGNPVLACLQPSPVNLKTLSWDATSQVFAVDGSAAVCAPVDSQRWLRFALYRPDTKIGKSPGWTVRSVQAHSKGISYRTTAAHADAGTYGICLIGAENARVSCAEITVSAGASGSAPQATMAAIGTSDDLVTKDVTFGPWGTGEDCYTCF
jgi:hypothetical protein